VQASGKENLVLGLDPGSRCTGYGLVSERSGVLSLVDTGTIRPKQNMDLSRRLGYIFERICEVIEAYRPMQAAVEEVFVSANTASALKLGQARGAALVACARHGVAVHAYEPALIKKNLVGAGRAEKGQVAFMVGRILGVQPKWPRDCSDALAAAVCHLNQQRFQASLARTAAS